MGNINKIREGLDEHQILKQPYLHIGCGDDYKSYNEGWLNLDVSFAVKADVYLDVRDLGKRFPENTFLKVVANGILEQLSHEEFRDVLNKIWEILKPNGVLEGQVPGFRPDRNNLKNLFYDPMDKLFFQRDSFKYFTFSEHAYKTFGKNYDFKPWDIKYCEFNENEIIEFIMSPHK